MGIEREGGRREEEESSQAVNKKGKDYSPATMM